MYGRLKNWLGGGGAYFLLELALIAGVAATAAHFTWVFLAPPAIGASSYATPAAARVDVAGARELFGTPPRARGPLRLVGIVAPDSAIFALEGGKSRATRAGEAIVPGAILKEVHRDYVLVERNGAAERLGLERASAGRDGGR